MCRSHGGGRRRIGPSPLQRRRSGRLSDERGRARRRLRAVVHRGNDCRLRVRRRWDRPRWRWRRRSGALRRDLDRIEKILFFDAVPEVDDLDAHRSQRSRIFRWRIIGLSRHERTSAYRARRSRVTAETATRLPFKARSCDALGRAPRRLRDEKPADDRPRSPTTRLGHPSVVRWGLQNFHGQS